jgi:glutamate synthase domain-containing protein 2
MTAGAEKNYPVDYSHINILGYALGAKGLPEGVDADPDHTLFPLVDTETEYGANQENKVRMKLPVFTGALGSTEVAAKNWEHFAIGAAISGITIVCGENVCGVDPEMKLGKNGKVVESPGMRRRVEIYKKYQESHGDLIVQLNVEDTRLGVAEYVIKELGVETIELKWGQGAKCIGGEIQIDSLSRALELQKRGYLVTPDPSLPAHKKAYEEGEIKHFERHSRLGFVDEESFHKEVERLRKLGAKRVTLKTGAYPMRELAMAIKWSSDAGIDLVTVDGAPGGTGMSPWRMMNEWGIPTFYLQSMAIEICDILQQKGAYVPDMAIAGGLSTEDHIFKTLAMGAPHFKAVCMGRAIMIPGMVGKNLESWLKNDELPKTIRQHGTTREEIFVSYEDLVDQFDKETVDSMPLGALAMYTFTDKLRVGLQQLMAGSRNFRLDTISRKDVAALTKEAAAVSGLSYITDAFRQEAMDILEG